MDKIKVGIIGTGSATAISAAHARGILQYPGAELTAVYSRTPASAFRWCDALGLDRSLFAASARELIDRCDAVIICTPNDTHTDYICQAAAAGRHILCEKPICCNAADAARIEAAIGSYTAKGMVNMSYRCIPAIRRLRQYLASGECGRIYAIRHNMGGSRLANEAIGLEWRFVRAMSGSGALGDFGSHAFDLLHYLLGREDSRMEQMSVLLDTYIPGRIGSDGTLRPVENDDSAMIQARLSCGAQYSLMLSRVGSPISEMDVIAANKLIRYSMARPDRLLVQSRKPGEAYGPAEEVFCTDCAEQWHDPSAVDMMACEANVQVFLDAIAKDLPVEQSLQYGLRIFRELEQAEAIAR